MFASIVALIAAALVALLFILAKRYLSQPVDTSGEEWERKK